MPLEAVVADANVILSTVIGKAAQRIFTEFQIRVHMTEFNSSEVTSYIPAMTSKYDLPTNLVLARWRLLKITFHKQAKYSKFFHQALVDMKDRDPEDAHALALARALKLPIWSNDRHLSDLDVPQYNTAQLLRILETKEEH